MYDSSEIYLRNGYLTYITEAGVSIRGIDTSIAVVFAFVNN